MRIVLFYIVLIISFPIKAQSLLDAMMTCKHHLDQQDEVLVTLHIDAIDSGGSSVDQSQMIYGHSGHVWYKDVMGMETIYDTLQQLEIIIDDYNQTIDLVATDGHDEEGVLDDVINDLKSNGFASVLPQTTTNNIQEYIVRGGIPITYIIDAKRKEVLSCAYDYNYPGDDATYEIKITYDYDYSPTIPSIEQYLTYANGWIVTAAYKDFKILDHTIIHTNHQR